MSTQPPTPNLDMMLEVTEESNKIGAFLDWMSAEMGLVICEWYGDEEDPFCEGGYHPALTGHSGTNRLLAAYYGIDYDEMERERQATLEWWREQQGG